MTTTFLSIRPVWRSFRKFSMSGSFKGMKNISQPSLLKITRRGRDSSFALRASAADSSPAEGKDTAIQHTASTHFRNDAPRNLRIRCETDMIIPFRNGGQHPTLQFSFILNRIYRHMESMAVPLTYFVTVLLLSLLTSAGDMGATCPSLHPTLALPLWSKTARFPLFPPYD